MDIIIRWLALQPTERKMVFQVTLLLGIIHVGLQIISFKRLSQFLDVATTIRFNPRTTDPEYSQRAAWAVSAVGRRLPILVNGSCLAQSLAVQHLYRRQGLKAQLCIGVTKWSDGRLKAHAWVESAGKIVIGGSQEELACYTRLPAIEDKLP